VANAEESDENVDFQVLELPTGTNSPEAAVSFLLGELIRADQITAKESKEIEQQIWHRETLGPTAIGGGIAFPYTRTDLISRWFAVVGRCSVPIEWPRALDGKPVNLICLVVVPSGSPVPLLRVLEQVVRHFRESQSTGDAPSET
jgi:mannitol/fructose-specific phosphotransferase system IIA component (Ntr-type)